MCIARLIGGCGCVPWNMSVINLHWGKIHGHMTEIAVIPPRILSSAPAVISQIEIFYEI